MNSSKYISTALRAAPTGRLRRPLIIVGAARSGTKLLRELLALHPDVAAVPFDVNFVWRLGSDSLRHDEIDASRASEMITQRIRQQVGRFQKGEGALVEKTVSNCLRVPFVYRVLPEARFVHLVRDGRDVFESAHRQWTTPTDWRYALMKLRRFPALSLRRYGREYALAVIRRGRSTHAQPTWGPRYAGIDEDLARLGLAATVARQWTICVEAALRGLKQVPSERVLTVRYEDLVTSPETHTRMIWSFIGVEQCELDDRAPQVRSDLVGTYRRLPDQCLESVLPHLEPSLSRLGYTNGPARDRLES